jgi:hypothetical protein
MNHQVHQEHQELGDLGALGGSVFCGGAVALPSTDWVAGLAVTTFFGIETCVGWYEMNMTCSLWAKVAWP